METISVERSIWIDAPRERVWQAITDPAQVEQWFSPGTQWRGDGLKVGGKLFVYDPQTDAELYVQIIDKLDPPHQLVTRSAPPETAYVTTWTLREENGGTQLTLNHAGYELTPAETRQQNMDQNGSGFGMVLENIKALIEGTSLPQPGGF